MKTIFKFAIFTFVLCGILYPTSIYLSDKVLPNSEENLIYVDGSLKGSEILNQDFSSDKYFHTDNIRPYITLEEANNQKETVMLANKIDEKTMDELLKDNTFDNLFFEYVNITTLNISIFKLTQ